jgi:hypothetical protein
MALAEIEGRPTTPDEQRSLREDLHRMGIQSPIQPARVEAHIAADNKACRPTLSLKLFGACSQILVWCTLAHLLRWLWPRKGIELRSWLWLCLMIVLGAFSFGGWLINGPTATWLWIFSVPPIAAVLLANLVMVGVAIWGAETALQAGSHWQHEHPQSIWLTLPGSVMRLVRDLEAELPDAKLRVLARDEDPFLVVSRGGERLFVAAWDTGDETLDYVPLRT